MSTTRRRSAPISRFHPNHFPINDIVELASDGSTINIKVATPSMKTDEKTTASLYPQSHSQPQPQPQPHPKTSKKNPLLIFAVVAFYFTTSLTTVLLNKHLLSSDFKDFTVFVTWIQTLFAIVASWIVGILTQLISRCNIKSKETNQQSPQLTVPFYEQWFSALLVSILFSSMLILGNLCLSYVHISFYQVARSWTCVISIILSFWFFGTKPSTGQLLSCVVVVAGYIIACDSELRLEELISELGELFTFLKSLSPFYSGPELVYTLHSEKGSIVLGIISGLFSSFMLALYTIANKRVQNRKIMSNSSLVFWLNTNSALIMFIYMLYTGELQNALQKSTIYEPSTILPLFIVSLSGFSLNFATVWQIQYTSPLAHTISGTAKASLQTTIGWYSSPNPVQPAGVFGTLMTIMGCFLFSFF